MPIVTRYALQLMTEQMLEFLTLAGMQSGFTQDLAAGDIEVYRLLIWEHHPLALRQDNGVAALEIAIEGTSVRYETTRLFLDKGMSFDGFYEELSRLHNFPVNLLAPFLATKDRGFRIMNSEILNMDLFAFAGNEAAREALEFGISDVRMQDHVRGTMLQCRRALDMPGENPGLQTVQSG